MVCEDNFAILLSTIALRCVCMIVKGSSGIRLTVAVTEELAVGERALAGSTLVLADCVICYMNEFSKMDEVDRTAIHELMEQRTANVECCQAGIDAALNKRAAILIVANSSYDMVIIVATSHS